MIDHQTSLQRLVHFFETLTPEQTRDLSTIYSVDAYFKDPFNDVRGLPAVTHIFQHMFVQVEKPRFKITSTVLQGDTAFLCWDFYFYMKKFNPDEQCIRGATHVRFSEDGKVQMHRDYWDAAEELYEKLPLLGTLMRWLKRTANK
ncbi:nuclear transport factor 2 family protein [Undibacterium sp. RuRC25W]|uniref:nuclear transport factor 2 family protein n=1 Tax=Undibacterium sp. RuRC25W TaxID=3413047 RepID=UPI003BF34BA8